MRPEEYHSPADPGDVEQSRADRARKIGNELLDMDDLARAAGHSLAGVIAKAAKDQFGIDIMPSDPDPEPETPETPPQPAF